MEEGEHRVVGLLIDAEVVETVAGREPLGSEVRRAPLKQRRGAAAKELAVALLIGCVQEEKTAQQRIGSHFGGAQQVAAAVGLGLAETEQLLHAPLAVAPDPAMDRGEHAIECRGG